MKHSIQKLVSIITPKRFGRIAYIGIFKIEFLLIRIFVKKNLKMWYRNSLLQNYFRFGLSDIDISIELDTNFELLDSAEKIQMFFNHCPLIKEINFYYPLSLQELPSLANYFELSKDIVLSKKIQIAPNNVDFIDAQKFTYLLRMYFSNLNQLKMGLSPRDVEKWSFHFELVGFPESIKSISEVKNEKDFLILIFSNFKLLNHSNFECIEYISQYQLQRKPLHLLLQQVPFPQGLIELMPHFFCFSGLSLNNSNNFCEEIFISQMSWEISGLMTQPTVFKNNKTAAQHLINLKEILEKSTFSSDISEKYKLNLIRSLKLFMALLEING